MEYQGRVEERQKKTKIAYITLGAGAGLAGAAVALYAIGGSLGSTASDRYGTSVYPEDFDDAEEDAEFARDIMIGGHVVMAAAAGVLGYCLYNFLTRPSDERPEEHKSKPMPLLSFSPAPSGGQLSLSGRF